MDVTAGQTCAAGLLASLRVAVCQLDGDLHVFGLQMEGAEDRFATTPAGEDVLKLAKTTDGSVEGDSGSGAFGPGAVPHSILPSPYSASSWGTECQTTCSCEVAITLPARTGAANTRLATTRNAIRPVTPIPFSSRRRFASLELSAAGRMRMEETGREPGRPAPSRLVS